MKTLLHATLSASGSPSEVKQRITDQVQAQATSSPDQAAALAAARGFIDKAILGVSEDDSLAVSATITVTVMEAPAVVTAKVQALTDEKDAAKRTAASLATQLATVQGELDAAKASLAATVTTETSVGV